jgi:hypothetical protein
MAKSNKANGMQKYRLDENKAYNPTELQDL